ncbi:hypothetical protein AVEN_110649-1 [Araneus ventricosus]|uniref:Uncharacterized protein n=1 Tax=Araneus ventricosus TaxID=182803 RepID=A0A4Y2AUE1_ARAVE|nr:hypothetical protein AVEN_110649-1 [Araneus ventricosus]
MGQCGGTAVPDYLSRRLAIHVNPDAKARRFFAITLLLFVKAHRTVINDAFKNDGQVVIIDRVALRPVYTGLPPYFTTESRITISPVFG